MKIPATVKTGAIFAAGLLFGAALFFPWNTVAEHAAAVAAHTAGAKGIVLEIKENSSEGMFDPRFLFSGIKASTPMALARISYLEADPATASFVGEEKRFSVNAGSGMVQGRVGGMMSWRSARADITLKKDSTLIENITVDGEIKGRGTAELSSSGKLVKADIAFTLPQKFDTVLEAVAMIGSLPLKKDPSGEWRLKK